VAVQEVSYAGVNLTVSTPEMQAAANAKFPGPQDKATAARGWPGATVAGQFESPDALELPVRLGSLFWPTGASRFAIGHFCVSAEQLGNILKVVGPGGQYPNNSALFIMKCGETAGMQTKLYMLPPRPFFNFGGAQLYILTLVDARYWWRYIVTGETDSSTSPYWDNLVDSLLSAIGNFDGAGSRDSSSPADWYVPPPGLSLRRVPAAFGLDALAYTLGKRVRRLLDGSYKVCSVATANGELDANVAAAFYARCLMAGGDPQDNDGFELPEKGQVAFSRSDSDDHLVIVKNLADLDPENFTFLKEKATKGWKANWLIDPYTSRDGLDHFTSSLVFAWGSWQGSAVSRTFAGIVPWLPEATADHIEWHVSYGFSFTAVRRPPWDDGVTELLGLMATGEHIVTGGGESFVTIRDEGTLGTGDDDQIYYDGRLNEWHPPEWVDDNTTEKVWYIARNYGVLAREETVQGHPIGRWNPSDENPSAANDDRRLFAGMPYSLQHDLIVIDSTPIQYGSIYFWRAKRQFYKTSSIAYQQRDTSEVWLFNKFNNSSEAFQVGHKVEATLVSFDDVDGSGVRKPLYKCEVTAISSDFLVCFMNKTLTRGGWFVIQGGRIFFMEKDGDGNCVEATDLESMCAGG
jgi:hypothetical protein